MNLKEAFALKKPESDEGIKFDSILDSEGDWVEACDYSTDYDFCVDLSCEGDKFSLYLCWDGRLNAEPILYKVNRK